MMKYILNIFGFLCFFLKITSSLAINNAVDKSWYSAEQDEYTISSSEQMAGLSELVSSGINFSNKTIFLNKDVDLRQYIWCPIGTEQSPFSGIFDGNGYSVSISRISAGIYGGLFGNINSATIKNVKVSTEEELQSLTTIGAIAAVADMTSSIENCTHTGRLCSKGAIVSGGIVGISNGIIKSCCNQGNIINDGLGGDIVGGIVGVNTGSIINSYNESSVSGTGITGGILGQSKETYSKVKIIGCHNIGTISSSNINSKEGKAISGGLAGIICNMDILRCYNDGSVISYCYKNGEYDTESCAYSGGLVGIGYGNIQNSYNIGNVASRCLVETNDNSIGLSYVYSGGLIGYNNGNILSKFSYCYNAGLIYAFGQGKTRAYINYGGIEGDFSFFTADLKSCYTLDNISISEGGNVGVFVPLNKESGLEIKKEKLSSPAFLRTSKEIISLNDDSAFVYDRNKINKGFPMLNDVCTLGYERSNSNIIIYGHAKISEGVKGFYYWPSGLKEHMVEVEVSDRFSYPLDRLGYCIDYYYQAFVKLPDGVILKGEIQKIHFL